MLSSHLKCQKTNFTAYQINNQMNNYIILMLKTIIINFTIKSAIIIIKSQTGLKELKLKFLEKHVTCPFKNISV